MSTVIDFANFEGPVYAGRDRGTRLREQICLDEVDASGETVEVRIPTDTYTITTGFFLGLFGPSVVRLGSKDDFYRKYQYRGPAFIKRDFDGYVARALQKF
jgi:hypothetical protein